MNDQLVPCSKCGSTNLHRAAVVIDSQYVHWQIKCEDCGNKGPEAYTIPWANKMWNEQEYKGE